MKSQFLLPETVARHEGTGPEIALGDSTGNVLLTLGITRIMEQESLDLTIWGSSGGDSWQQIAAFPQKFYCGTYSLLLSFKNYREVNSIRAQWKMARWGRGDLTPLFGFYVFAEEANVAAAVGGR
jgi:hypothetical protein